MAALEKICSVCNTREKVSIETVTNVAPRRGDMFPVILCVKHKAMLAKGELDVRLNKNGDLFFVFKKKKSP